MEGEMCGKSFESGTGKEEEGKSVGLKEGYLE